MSHPTRGAWIETKLFPVVAPTRCRTPPGVRGLKPVWTTRALASMRRTPPGVRGLKHL